MKRNLFTKSIVVSVALSALLAGCGSTTANDTKTDTTQIPKTITGKAVDGYLQYATVCLDINKDGYCQQEEPSTQTTLDGSFKLDIKPEIEKQAGFDEAMLLVYGGKDVDTGSDFRGKLLAPQDTDIVNISPITTLIAKDIQKELKTKRYTKEEIKDQIEASKEKVANFLDLPTEDLMKDPVAHKSNNPGLIKKALKLQKSIEVAIADGDDDKIEKLYEKLADKMDKIDANGNLDALFESTFQNETAILAKIKTINENLDTSFEKFDGDLEKIAFITKDDLRKAKKGETFKRNQDDVAFSADFDWDKAYIVSDLEDIGIAKPSDEEIAKIKEIHTEIKPGTLKDVEKELQEREDEIFKKIDEALKKQKETEEKRKEHKKAKIDPGVKVDLKAMLSGKTLYVVDVDNELKSANINILKFNENMTLAQVNDEKKTTIKIDGNNIYADDEGKKDVLTFKKEKEAYYEFYTDDGESVKFYKTKEKAELNRAEMEKKIEKPETSQEGQTIYNEIPITETRPEEYL